MRIGCVVAVCGLAGLLGLMGCSGTEFKGSNEGSETQATSTGATLRGLVHGGQNPIAGAHVYLLAAASGASGAGAAAYGGNGIAASSSNASQSLLTSGTLDTSGGATNGDYYVTSGADGSFSITGDYICEAGQQVYLYALSGNPGLGTGVNPAAGLLATLGACPSGGNFLSGSNPISYIVVNEVSTVAAAFAIAGFATDALHVGSSGTTLAQTGIANAFANATNLETIGTGIALATTPAGNGTVPQAEINSLADSLAACVNSNGAGTACATLFANATVDGTSTGAQPTDTATAAINIAHHPGVNVASVYTLGSSTPPFSPSLSAAPNDFIVAIQLSGGGLTMATAVAIDTSGNAWVTDNYSSATSGDSLSEFSNLGAALSPSRGYDGGSLYGPNAVAIDPSGSIWLWIIRMGATAVSPSSPVLDQSS